MDVTIFGTGNMGKGIGTRAVAGGHNVTFVGTSTESAEKVADEVRLSAKKGASVTTASLKDVTLGDIVVLAVWYGTNIELAKMLGSRLAGKVVVDIANPVNATYDGLATAPDSSSAEDVAKVISPGAKVVKAFNTTFAGTLMSGEIAGQPLDVFIAGDDVDAKNKVAELVRDGGMRPLDVGPLHRARQLEGMQLLQIVLQGQLGTNWGSSVKIIG
jgi:NADPH-dependent F420 reductase